MRLGLVDIGTNSVRLDIYAIRRPHRVERIYRQKTMVRLGDRVFSDQRLDHAATQRTLSVLADFQRHCQSFRVDSVVSLATCALREARNRQQFIQQAAQGLGLTVEVISGQEEATLILRGILNDEQTTRETFGFVDIGGGSTEIGVCHRGTAVYLESFPFGSARLAQEFPVGTWSFERQAQQLERWRHHLQKLFRRYPLPKEAPAPSVVLGSSGSVRALKKIMVKSGYGKKIRRKHLGTLVENLAELSPPNRMRRIPGLSPERADLILPGAVILQEALCFLGANTVRHTKFSLRDGILARELERLQIN